MRSESVPFDTGNTHSRKLKTRFCFFHRVENKFQDFHDLMRFGLIFQVKPRERISAFAGMKHSYFSDLPQSIHTLPDSKSLFKACTHCYFQIIF